MSEVRHRFAEQGGPIPFRAAEGLQITSASKGKSGAQTHYIRSRSGEIVELGEEEYFIFALLDGNPTFDDIQREFKTRFAGDLSRRHFQELMNELLSAEIVKEMPSALPAQSGGSQPTPSAQETKTITAKAAAAGGDIPADAVVHEAGTTGSATFSLWPLFMVLARLGSPVRYGTWLLIPALPVAAVILFGQEARIASTLRGLDWSARAMQVSALSAVLAVLLIPAVGMGVAAAFHGAPRETFRPRLSAWHLPAFPVNRAAIDILSREGRTWSYATPLLTRLFLSIVGVVLWAAYQEDQPQAAAGLLLGGLALLAFLLTAFPLWPADGRRWMAAYFDDPTRKLIAVRGFVIVGTGIWLVAVAGLALPWMGLIQTLPSVDVTGACLTGAAAVAALIWIKVAASVAGPLAGSAPPAAFSRRGPGVPTAFVPSGAYGRDIVGGHAGPSLADRLRAGSGTWAPLRTPIVLAIIFGIAITIIFLPYPYELGGSFTVMPFNHYSLVARVSGEVTEVLVREGDWVKEGQVVGTLSDWSEVHQLAVQEAELDQAQAALQALLITPKPEEVMVAQRQYEQALSRLPYSKSEYERDLALVKTNDVSFKVFEQALSTYQQDMAAVNVTKANYDYVRVGPTQAQIAAARAQVQLATDQVSYWRDQLGRTRIRATASGQVVTPDPQLMIGKFLLEGSVFVNIEDHRVAHVEVQVPETDIRDIHIGSLVRAKAWGYEHTMWLGKTILIAPDAQPNQTLGNVVRVVAEIPNPDGLLRPDMSGDAKVETVDMPVWISYTRAIMRFLLIEVWYWIP